MFTKLRSIIVLVASIGAGLSFCVMISAVLIQVTGRTLGSSPVWTEELTRFALLYMTAFGVGLSLRSGDLVNVDIVCDALPKPFPIILKFVSAVITLGLCLFLIMPALKFFSIGAMQTSPALGLRMDIMHFSIVALLVLLAVFCVLRIGRILLGMPAHHIPETGDPS